MYEQDTQQVYSTLFDYGKEMNEFRQALGSLPFGLFGQCS